MKFRTEVTPLFKEPKINHSSKIILIGSCFVENIGNKFDYFKFQNLRNPFGILFHPEAIYNLISKAVNNFEYSEADVFYRNEQWHSFDAHSDLNKDSAKELVLELNQQLKNTREYLYGATHIFITLGTSWGYKNNSSMNTVANCHKVPQKEFVKNISGVDEVESFLLKTVNDILALNSNIEIIFTVSPVRHLKEGIVENQRSKANLLAAVHNVIETKDHMDYNLSYFPSYEILMDDLRDYRFYSEDMIHPNEIAIRYIWEKLTDTWISPESISIMKEIDSVQKDLQHKPFNAVSEASINFKKSISLKIDRLTKKLPNIKF